MKIVTLTINPALDKSTTTEQVIAMEKIRCQPPKFEAGGGGINVSRALKLLGCNSKALLMQGGANGKTLLNILDEDGIAYEAVKTKHWTRENFEVYETSTGRQFRFGMPGRQVYEDECKELLQLLKDQDADAIVASGSLAPGVPVDFYAQVAEIAKAKGARLILDSSGEPLKKAAEAGGIYLMKPNLGELAAMAGKDQISSFELEDTARELLQKKAAEILVVSLGPQGAMLATQKGMRYFTPPLIKARSAVGAGDSMVAGIVYGLHQKWDLEKTVMYGIAAGTAASMTPGTELCRKPDVERIFKWMQKRNEC